MGRREKPTKAKAKAKRPLARKAPKKETAGIHELEKRLAEALEQQAATAEILKVISSSPGELEPVFQAMLANATRICEAKFGILFRFGDDGVRAAAMLGVPPAFAEFWQRGPHRPGPRTAHGRVMETRQTVHIADVTADPAYLGGEPVHGEFVNPRSCGSARAAL